MLFEVGLGRLVLGLPWEWLAEDDDLLWGGFMDIVLLVMTLSPLLAARLRGTTRGTGPPAHNDRPDR